MTILELRDVHKAWPGRPVLNGISFRLEQGEACTIIGSSGEGKTTLLKCMNLLLPIDRGEIRLSDQVIVHSTGLPGSLQVEMDPATVRRRIGMVFQEWNLWPNMTIRDNIALALRHVNGSSREHAYVLAAESAKRVRITDQLDSYPNALSGGQKQRAAIARALAMNPEILMLDEVTSALDPVLAGEVLDVIGELKRDGRTLIVVTHHIEFARAVSDQVIFLHRGKVHETGSSTILEAPQTGELQWFLQRIRRVQ
jgi:polar amino acid transport system ATP-binding protein